VIDPSVPQSRFENLAQRHDFPVHGVMRWRLAAHRLSFFKAMDAIFIDLASRDLGKNHAAEERDEMAIGTRVLSARIGRATLSLRHDVEFAQVQLRSFAERLAALQLTVAELASQLQIPVFCELLRFSRGYLLWWLCAGSFRLDKLRIAS
jgi:hypothetical protein